MDKNKKFDFPAEIEEALSNLELWPKTERGAIPHWPTSWFIVTENQKMVLVNIINTLDEVSSESFSRWTDDEKRYYSALLNSAERVLHNSLSIESHDETYNQESMSHAIDMDEK